MAFWMLGRRCYDFRRCQELQATGFSSWETGPQREAFTWDSTTRAGKECSHWPNAPFASSLCDLLVHLTTPYLQCKSKHRCYLKAEKLQYGMMAFFIMCLPHTWNTKERLKVCRIIHSESTAADKYICMWAYKQTGFWICSLVFQENKTLVINKDFGKDLGNSWYRSFHFLEHIYCCR